MNVHAKETGQLSFVFGVINFVFAIPALYYIDRTGRRNLLLWTFPFMALFQFLTGGAFQIEGISKKWLVVASMYCFSIAYSVGEGPVPFVSSAPNLIPVRQALISFSRSTLQKACLFTFAITVSNVPLPSRGDLNSNPKQKN